jgi:hypothetical protein
MVDIGFDDIQKGVKRVRDTLGDLRAINEQLNMTGTEGFVRHEGGGILCGVV